MFHHYWVDAERPDDRANLLIATGQNNQAMNLVCGADRPAFSEVRDATARQLDEGILNRLEAAIRCYDPCLSCSTHALGQMPLEVELVAPDGAVLQTVAREA